MLDKASLIPMISAQITAPGMEDRPPITIATKALMPGVKPMAGKIAP